MQKLAENLEAGIKGHNPRKEIDVQIVELKLVMESLISQLEKKLPKESEKIAVVVVPKLLKAVCDKLDALLTDDDSSATELMNAERGHASFCFPGTL